LETGCSFLLKLLGLIDPHVHLREPGAPHKEDWDTGMSAALAAARAGMCNFSLDPTASAPISLRQHLLGSELWNIEAFDYGSACE